MVRHENDQMEYCTLTLMADTANQYKSDPGIEAGESIVLHTLTLVYSVNPDLYAK